MMVIPWIRSTIGVILPGIIDTFHLTLSQAGLVTVFIETGSVGAMLALGLFIDRIGAARAVSWGLPAMSAALMISTVLPSFAGLSAALFLLGVGIALTASGINMLMASTGARRGFYLGVLHATFSVFSIVTPLAAGLVLALADWRLYYRLAAGLALIVMIVFRLAERSNGRSQEEQAEPAASDASPYGAGVALKRISTLCLGVAALAGVQGIFMTWSYLYMIDVYRVGHSLATVAPSLVWLGIMVGRTGIIALQRCFSARTILLWSILLAAAALSAERLASTFWVTSLMLVILGMGVAGAFQLGTAWAAERIPERVGTASTYVMASAALGIGFWPWITGVIIDAKDFTSLMYTALAGLALAAVMFAITEVRTVIPINPKSQILNL